MSKLTIKERFEKGKCLSPEGVVSFPNVFEPLENKFSKKKQYKLDLILQSQEDVDEIKEYIALALENKFGKRDTFVKYSPLREPNKTAGGAPRDTEKYPEYKDKYYITFVLDAEKNSRPLIVDSDNEEILAQCDFYAGCKAKVHFQAYAYDNGATGVNFYMNIIKKTSDGSKISGGPSYTPSQVFDDLLED